MADEKTGDLEQRLPNDDHDLVSEKTQPRGTESVSAESQGGESLGLDGAGENKDEASEESVSPYELEDRDWLRSIWRPTLITILAGCLVVAFMAFARRIAPELPPEYTRLTVAIGLLTAVIGCTSTTWLAQPSQRSSRNMGYRAAELAFIVVLTRVATWAATGNWPGFDLVLRPLDSLLDPYFIVALIAVLLAWIMATAMTDDMINMGLRPDDIYMSRTYTDKWQDTARPVYTNRPAILQRFTGRWVAGGVLLVVMAAGSRFAAPEPGFFLPIIGQNIDRTVIIAVIVYFLAGLALISQGQLALLRARWTLQKTPSAPGVLRNWPVYALVLIVVTGFIAALLPLGGTFHLALILSTIIEFSYWLVLQIFGTIMGLFLLLASLFGGEEQPQEMPTPAPPPVLTPQPAAEPPMELPPWTGGAIFWIIAALLLGYAAYIYFGGRGVSFAWLHLLWQMLRKRWNQMLDGFEDWQASHVRSVDDDSSAPGDRRRRRLLNWLGYRGLDPDAQIRYYYLSMLEQAEQTGRSRHSSETPHSYAPRLVKRLADSASSDASDDVAGATDQSGDKLEPGTGPETETVIPADGEAIYELTDAFVRVRYARGHFDADEAAHLRNRWNRIKRLLRL